MASHNGRRETGALNWKYTAYNTFGPNRLHTFAFVKLIYASMHLAWTRPTNRWSDTTDCLVRLANAGRVQLPYCIVWANGRLAQRMRHLWPSLFDNIHLAHHLTTTTTPHEKSLVDSIEYLCWLNTLNTQKMRLETSMKQIYWQNHAYLNIPRTQSHDDIDSSKQLQNTLPCRPFPFHPTHVLMMMLDNTLSACKSMPIQSSEAFRLAHSVPVHQLHSDIVFDYGQSFPFPLCMHATQAPVCVCSNGPHSLGPACCKCAKITSLEVFVVVVIELLCLFSSSIGSSGWHFVYGDFVMSSAIRKIHYAKTFEFGFIGFLLSTKLTPFWCAWVWVCRSRLSNHNNDAATIRIRKELDSFPYLLELSNSICVGICCSKSFVDLHLAAFRNFFRSSFSRRANVIPWNHSSFNVVIIFSSHQTFAKCRINSCLLSSLHNNTRATEWEDGRRSAVGTTATEIRLFNFWFNFNWSEASSRAPFPHPVSLRLAWHNFPMQKFKLLCAHSFNRNESKSWKGESHRWLPPPPKKAKYK